MSPSYLRRLAARLRFRYRSDRFAPGASGSASVNAEPSPGTLAASRRPPCASAMTRARPKLEAEPAPRGASASARQRRICHTTRSSSSAAMPRPVGQRRRGPCPRGRRADGCRDASRRARRTSQHCRRRFASAASRAAARRRRPSHRRHQGRRRGRRPSRRREGRVAGRPRRGRRRRPGAPGRGRGAARRPRPRLCPSPSRAFPSAASGRLDDAGERLPVRLGRAVAREHQLGRSADGRRCGVRRSCATSSSVSPETRDERLDTAERPRLIDETSSRTSPAQRAPRALTSPVAAMDQSIPKQRPHGPEGAPCHRPPTNQKQAAPSRDRDEAEPTRERLERVVGTTIATSSRPEQSRPRRGAARADVQTIRPSRAFGDLGHDEPARRARGHVAGLPLVGERDEARRAGSHRHRRARSSWPRSSPASVAV